jgi:4-amino-4-deoxy-L-arabinose transferase-like glycosyltransferase
VAARAPLGPLGRGEMEVVSRAERRAVLVLLAVLVALLFLDLPGSYLLEPDEARYAEIPREMLATGNWLVPRLNGVDYFEKPPLAYWLNAVSISALGRNPFAARLASRLAAVGTVLVLLLGLRRDLGERAALWAALVCLSGPLFFGLGRTNLTDGALTFCLTLAVVAIYRFLRARENGARAPGWAALAGLSCGLAVLAKGLIGVVLPGGALLLWCLIRRRARPIGELLWSWAPVLFLAATVPYFWAVERAAPGFSWFFWIHEHFLRYTTAEARRPGPVYYFAALFAAGFLPWTFFLGPVFARLRRGAARDRGRSADLWFGLFAAVVLVFFSLSRSKLPPYILPVFPAAAVLVARGLGERFEGSDRPLLGHALFWTLAAPAGIAAGLRGGDLRELGVTGLAVAGAAVMLGGSWAAWAVSRRDGRAGVLTVLGAWSIFYAVLIFAFPRLAAERSAHALAEAARRAEADGATVVCYRDYLQGFPWILEHRVPIYGWRGELAFGSERGDQSAWFRSREDFLKDWDSGRRMVALVRRRDDKDLAGHRARLLAQNRKYLVVKNF